VSCDISSFPGDYESEADQNEALYNFLINLQPGEADNYVSGRGEEQAQSNTPQPDGATAEEERKREEERLKREQFEREKQQKLEEKAAKERAEKERLLKEKEERERKLREEQERLAREREAQRERERKQREEEERRRREAEERDRKAREESERVALMERLALEQARQSEATMKLQQQEDRERKRSSENLLLKRTYSRGLVRTMSEGSRLVADPNQQPDGDANATDGKGLAGSGNSPSGSPARGELLMGGQRSRPFLNPRQQPTAMRPSSLNHSRESSRDTFAAIGNKTAEQGDGGDATYAINNNGTPTTPNNPALNRPSAQITRPSSSHGFVTREQSKNVLSSSAERLPTPPSQGDGGGESKTSSVSSAGGGDKLAQAKSVPELNVTLLRNSASGASSFRKSAKPTNSQVMAEALSKERANEQSPQRGSSGASGSGTIVFLFDSFLSSSSI
jgi:hypothetical protein